MREVLLSQVCRKLEPRGICQGGTRLRSGGVKIQGKAVWLQNLCSPRTEVWRTVAFKVWKQKKCLQSSKGAVRQVALTFLAEVWVATGPSWPSRVLYLGASLTAQSGVRDQRGPIRIHKIVRLLGGKISLKGDQEC